nr:YfhO family protein [Secundilactobacillus similis]
MAQLFAPHAHYGSYFAYRHMAPFGNSSLLTVDLGQQYVDFFAYFRHSLLHDPSGIFYTFQKALGGEMFGIWTYYLLSPFNLILLLFPDKFLPSAIFLMTVLKYGAAGLSFAWLLMKSKLHPGFSALIFSTSYALMGG